jgi:tetratricopeptide (TPR) repeat protein
VRLARWLVLVQLGVPGAATAQAPDSLLAVVQSLEAAGRWREAIPPLERYLALVPGDATRNRQLGQYLAWQGDRAGSLTRLRRAVELAPASGEHLAALGEVLSWDPGSRSEAEQLFARALSADPANERAREGEANLLAWRGRAREALPRYDALLALNPRSVGALRGKAAALNMLERHAEAEPVLVQAASLAPADPWVTQERARTEVGLERFDRARQAVDAGAGAGGPEIRELRDTVLRATRHFAEVNAMLRTRSEQLDARRGEVRVAPYLGSGLRLDARYQRTSYRDSLGDFSADAGTVGIGWHQSRRFGLDVAVTGRSIAGVDGTLWDGRVGLSVRPADNFKLSLAGARDLVEETRQSVENGVQANLATFGVEWLLLGRRIELIGHLVAGRYTADGFADNQRFGGDVLAGLVVRSYQPYLRLSYGFMSSAFDYNASADGVASATEAAGYFSPDEFYLNYGAVTVSQRFGARVFWEFDGRLGQQIVREHPGENRDGRVAAAVNTHVAFRLGRTTDLDFRYVYSDAFSAFRLHEGRLVFRQYF